MSSLSQSTRNSSWNLPKASSGQQQLSVTDRYNLRKNFIVFSKAETDNNGYC
jgi:hypothetical protein